MKGLVMLVACWTLFLYTVLHYTPPATIAWVVITGVGAIWSLNRYSIIHDEPKERSDDEPL
ncbi:MAG: hypothetical protein EBU46_00285 [Nitrosomonadaceae bacterium]|nr:hypothetical protein [Nitrosomonadaceae bacterium]